jgi:hypothetical protein
MMAPVRVIDDEVAYPLNVANAVISPNYSIIVVDVVPHR